MPFVLIVVGLMLVVAGVRGQESELLSLIKSDFTGNGSFKGSYFAWVAAIGVLGGLGYIQKIRPIANAFLVLVILILFLSNRGFFSQFNQALQSASSSSSMNQAQNASTSAWQTFNNSGMNIPNLFGSTSTQANAMATQANAQA
jgi:hypothetical protein